MEKTETKDTLLLIDANSLIHRAFHALPPLKTPEGRPSGALYGLATIIIKILREKSPRYIVAAFDRPEPTFRKKEYNAYKGTRSPTVDELITQLKEAKNLLDAFGIKSIESPGFEADDIVATLASKFSKNEKLKVVVFSGDLDTLQMVEEKNVVVEFPKKGISDTSIYDREAVEERFGVKPEQLADYKGLVGDTSDNIPGVPGIGPKTAEKLINSHKNLESLYKDIEEIGISDIKLQAKLKEFKEQAFLSKKLATLRIDVPIDVELTNIETRVLFEKEKALTYVDKISSETLRKRIENDLPNRYNN